MEEEGKNIVSPVLEKPIVQKQFDDLKKVVEEAQKRIDYTVAHDDDVKKAIDVVERFLRKKKRVCYGGQAINSLLPQEHKFYDSEFTVPDYDFFSPTVSSDVDELIDMLQGEGFTEVNKKVGMHEGTMKVYVNYIPVADCSELHPRLFKIVQSRAVAVEGILYCDPDFLRMMMYLELSRPRGEVDRWKKVFERLTLLNYSYPPGECKEYVKVDTAVSLEDREEIINFVQKYKRVLAGTEVIELLSRGKGFVNKERLVKFGGPVIFLTKEAKQDADDLKDILTASKGGVRIESYEVEVDSLFPFTTISRGGTKIALILQEEACHGYTPIKLNSGSDLRLATPDTLLHLYYSFLLFGRKEKSFFQTSLECLIQKIHSVAKKAREFPSQFLPAFGLKCSGHQKGMATLLKEKQTRTEKEKKALKALKNKTKKNRK
jgi:hypothetical protein